MSCMQCRRPSLTASNTAKERANQAKALRDALYKMSDTLIGSLVVVTVVDPKVQSSSSETATEFEFGQCHECEPSSPTYSLDNLYSATANRAATEAKAADLLSKETAAAEVAAADFSFLLKVGRLPTSPQQRFTGAPQRSPAWPAMVAADEAGLAERAVAEMTGADKAKALRAMADSPPSKAMTEKEAVEKAAAAEIAAAGSPQITRKRRNPTPLGAPEQPQLEQRFTNAASELDGPQLAVRMTEP